jgi:hypothetical protein
MGTDCALSRSTVTRVCALLALITYVLCGYAQDNTLVRREEIDALIGTLASHSANPVDLLDPGITGIERVNRVSVFAKLDYEFRFQPSGDLKINGDIVSLPGRMYFKNPQKQISVTTELNFVRREGRWYFADYDFAIFPVWAIALMALGCSISIGYAVGILILRARLDRLGILWQGTNWIKIFLPFLWPTMFRVTSVKSQTATIARN